MDSRCKFVRERMISLAAGERSHHASQAPVAGVRKLRMPPHLKMAKGFSRMCPCPCLVGDIESGIVPVGIQKQARQRRRCGMRVASRISIDLHRVVGWQKSNAKNVTFMAVTFQRPDTSANTYIFSKSSSGILSVTKVPRKHPIVCQRLAQNDLNSCVLERLLCHRGPNDTINLHNRMELQYN